MTDDDVSLDEKRVYGETRDATVAFVASELGLVRVAISGDQIGRVGLVLQDGVHDVAGGNGRLLVATDEDVLVGTDGDVERTEFGTAVTVGVAGGGDDELLAAGPDGRVARLVGNDWQAVGTVEEPRRFDGRYLATGEGVVRVGDGRELAHLGLFDVRDVAATGPFAATADGCYERVDGEWAVVHEGDCGIVAVDGEHVHVGDDEGLHERVGGEWTRCALPTGGRVADVAYGEAPYAVTADGTFLVDADPDATPDGQSGWRHRALGVPDVRSVAVP